MLTRRRTKAQACGLFKRLALGLFAVMDKHGQETLVLVLEDLNDLLVWAMWQAFKVYLCQHLILVLWCSSVCIGDSHTLRRVVGLTILLALVGWWLAALVRRFGWHKQSTYGQNGQNGQLLTLTSPSRLGLGALVHLGHLCQEISTLR